MRWLAGRLCQIRVRERALRASEEAAPSRRDRAFAAARNDGERRTLTAEKMALKDAALQRHSQKLGRFLLADLQKAVDGLTQARLTQYALGRELGEGVGAKRRAEIEREIREVDKRKVSLKANTKGAYGVAIGRRAQRVPSWHEGLRSAQTRVSRPA
mmetsp:Transcript_58994/g.139351  ORF Transcript_58994/g.139351 Transcript_58994/m.139351 type:complete len:157 (+) Transcript_58994:29-499(+)